MDEVERKIDYFYRRAESATATETETATETHGAPKERTGRQRTLVSLLLDDVAKRTQKFTAARERLGALAAGQYRGDTSPQDTAALLLANTPQDYFDQTQLMNRLTRRQKEAVDAPAPRRSAAARQRREAPRGAEAPADAPDALQTAKATVQKKLRDAREVLSRLGAEPTEQQRPASSPAQQAAVGSWARQGTPGTSARQAAAATSASTKAEKALAFARAQIGKPCVWGASGPGSYDSSGLTQAAWKAAGVALPRATRDQAGTGTPVPLADARPGDLVFFYDAEISHVGVYAGDGMMIHAPGPGAYVREEPVHLGGETIIHSVVRMA